MRHMMKALLVAALLGFPILLSAQPSRTVHIPRLRSAPLIDGDLGDPAWNAAATVSLREIKGGTLKNATSGRIGYDDDFLYVAMRCEEADMANLRAAWSHAEERDNSIWQDDCVEVLLDPLSRGTATGMHIVVNSAGVCYDAWDGDRSWDCEVQVATALGKDAWTVEIAIPFRDLGFHPKGGERWLLNLGREEKPVPELSCLGVGSGNFGSPERYVSAVFGGGGAVTVDSVAVGGKDLMQLSVANPSNAKAEFEAALSVLRQGKAVFANSATATAAPNAPAKLQVRYQSSPGTQTLRLLVTNRGTGAKLYENEVLLRRPGTEPKKRVWQLGDPLYEELLSTTPTGLVRDGAMYWFPEIDHGKYWLFACQYGMRYVKADKYAMLAEHLLRPLHNSYVLTTPHYGAFEQYRKHGVKAILYPNTKGVKHAEDMPTTFLLDPASTEKYLADVRATLTEYGDVVWAVTFGDEMIDHVESSGIKLFAEYAEKYPYIKEVDAQVKAQFGAGQFGIPRSKGDKNAFRWIAYRRWLTANLNELLAKLAKTVREIRPGTLIISDDPVALHHALDYSGMRAHADIVTHQLYPRRDPTYPYFGYLTKIMGDLTGVAEVWPCPHVEEYGVSYRPEEVLEELSQVVRNGGTGFQLYLTDTVGRRKGKRCLMNEFYGAPDRWQVVTAVLAELRQTRKLRFPDPDCAILFATDTVASHPDRGVSDKLPCQYTLLGPLARSFFVFVDEFQIGRGETDLAKFKALYVPDARYVRRSTAAALRAYVEAGGTLVATDPQAFSYFSDGTDTGDLRRELFGMSAAGTKRRRTLTYAGRTLPVLGASYNVSPSAAAKVVAQFDDGTAAIVTHRVGQGTCWYFAANPCARKALANTDWQAFFTDLQKTLGVKTGQDIWRFRFPASLIKPPALPQGKCLTNNHFAWRSFKPIQDCNLDTAGFYTYSVLPDNIRDQGGKAAISFAKGDLTDRRAAPTAGDVISKKSNIQDWVVRYRKPDPFHVTFDLQQAQQVNRVRVFFTGPATTLSVATSSDGQQWQQIGQSKAAATDTREVGDIVVEFDPTPARYLRLAFPKRPPKSLFTLSEVEIWAP